MTPYEELEDAAAQLLDASHTEERKRYSGTLAWTRFAEEGYFARLANAVRRVRGERDGDPQSAPTRSTYRKVRTEAEMSVNEGFRVLELLKRGSCWCEVAIGNPMVKDHSEGCKRAQRLMAWYGEA